MQDLKKEFDLDNIDFDNLLDDDEEEILQPYPEPTKLRISTMTATCKTNVLINLKYITDITKVINYYSNNLGIIKIIYGKQIIGMCKKDLEGKGKKKKVFFNQATVVIRCKFANYTREINIKLFSNGGVQMTGLKSDKEGVYAVNMLFDILKKIKGEIEENDLEGNITKKEIKLIDNPNNFSISDFNIVLINSDFASNFEIKREKLHSILQNNYHLFSTYEPCIYPGVNSKYYWNKTYENYPLKGKCYCDNYCDGKGTGNGESNCKKITISTFQSGNVIITGARSIQQINDAYEFINNVFKKEYLQIKKIKLSFVEKKDNKNKGKKIVYLKKSKIKFLEKPVNSN